MSQRVESRVRLDTSWFSCGSRLSSKRRLPYNFEVMHQSSRKGLGRIFTAQASRRQTRMFCHWKRESSSGETLLQAHVCWPFKRDLLFTIMILPTTQCIVKMQRAAARVSKIKDTTQLPYEQGNNAQEITTAL